jgi:hypothetical protein
MADDAARDEQVIDYRSRGRSYAGIAKELGFARSADASDAFNRALRLRPAAERAELLAQEEQRLDALAEKTRRRPDLTPDDVGRRLEGLERVRARLLAS